MASQGWNIDVPPAEYYGPVPAAWQSNIRSGDLGSLLAELQQTKLIAIDTETTGLVVWRDIPLYFSLAWDQRRATLHQSLLPYFEEKFKDPTCRWVFANAKYDAHILSNVGARLAGPFIDTQVQHSLLYEEQPHNLKYMAQQLLGWRWSDFQDTFGKITKAFSPASLIERAEIENFLLLVQYAANDAWGTLSVYRRLEKELAAAGAFSLFNDKPPYITTLHDLFHKVEVPYTKVLWKNERNGILVDHSYLTQVRPVAETEIRQLEQQIAQTAGWLLRPTSTPDLRKYFFEQIKLSPTKMTKGGKSGDRKPSVDSDFLEYYADSVPMAALVLQHRSVTKLYGTYITGLADIVDPRGRIHTRFNQDVARTGRLSSSDPNLQNIPKEENDKWRLRGAFTAMPGHKLIVADYRQLEMRLLAAAAGEKDMIDIFLKGWDIHMGNAALVFNVPYEDLQQAKKISKQVKAGELSESHLTPYVRQCLRHRDDIKAIGFGLNYGMGERKLAKTLGITVEEAENLIAKYMGKYPAVSNFYRGAIEETERTGYAYTILGRRRTVTEIRSTNRGERGRAERIAVNMQIQGSAADVVKCAQVTLDKCGLDDLYGCHSLLQVHDELVHECPDEYVERCKNIIAEHMEHPFIIDLLVPLEVDIGAGNTWLEAK
jgi:DNA polymerase-1